MNEKSNIEEVRRAKILSNVTELMYDINSELHANNKKIKAITKTHSTIFNSIKKQVIEYIKEDTKKNQEFLADFVKVVIQLYPDMSDNETAKGAKDLLAQFQLNDIDIDIDKLSIDSNEENIKNKKKY